MAFWKRKPKLLKEALSIESLGVDMHSHLIPGIDDGAPDMATSLDLIQGLVSFGYKKLITTPHIMSDFYKNDSSIIRSGRDKVREALDKKGIEVAFDCAAEYYTDQHFEQLIANKDILTFGDNYVLFEFGFMDAPPMADRVIFELQMAGYKPVLAHPERYTYWHSTPDKLETLHSKGVILQVNINSLTGAYDETVRKSAIDLVEKDMVGFIGTDCHHGGHLNLMHHALHQPSLKTLLDKGNLLNPHLM